MRRAVFGAVFAISGSPASAGGFYVPEIGGRAAGMGAAVVADGDDPSATFHDPANLVGLRDIGAYGGQLAQRLHAVSIPLAPWLGDRQVMR